MKSFILILLSILLQIVSVVLVRAQVPGFKIDNGLSSITHASRLVKLKEDVAQKEQRLEKEKKEKDKKDENLDKRVKENKDDNQKDQKNDGELDLPRYKYEEHDNPLDSGSSQFDSLVQREPNGKAPGNQLKKPDEKGDLVEDAEMASVYATEEIILYNNYVQRELLKAERLNDLTQQLYYNSTSAKPTMKPGEVGDSIRQSRILVKELQEIDNKKDSLYYIYTRDYVNYDRFIAFTFGPLRSRAFFDIIYDNEGKTTRFVNNTGFNFGAKSAAFYSELFSGHLKVFRVSLGAMIASTTTEQEDREEEKQLEAYQRLATYGGNTVLNLEYPLLYFHSRNKQFNLLSRALARGSADLPAFGSTTDKVAGNISYGIDLYGDATTDNNVFRFFFNFNVHRLKGTDIFKENLGVGSTAFNYGQLIAGVVVAQKIKISFIVATVSSEEILRNKRLIGGGQVLHE